jgi:hypothetical protein
MADQGVAGVMVNHLSPIRSIFWVSLAVLFLIIPSAALQAQGWTNGPIMDLIPFLNYGYPIYTSYEPYANAPYLSGPYASGPRTATYVYDGDNLRLAKRWTWHNRGYGDEYEFHGWKRGPLLREKPPYPAYVPGDNVPMDISPVKLSWSRSNGLSVKWQGRAEPVKSVDVDVTDRYNGVLSHQTVAEAPFHIKVEVPEAAAYIRVTVKYEDGGVASSALRLGSSI